jgi:C4-dicarboxylate-specific signal transduction histidine kinase
VNPVRLEQVLVNLVANASDALTERSLESPRILITIARREDGRVACSIRDNAGGIPPEILTRIFEPYFTTKGPERGTGLGLPVVKQIVESYGGTLGVDTTPGAGSTFTFDLPPAAAA